MINWKYLVLLISVLSILQVVKSDEAVKQNYIACNASSATAEVSGCPAKSKCIENGTKNEILSSWCVCEAAYVVNQKYSSADNKSVYCVLRNNETHPTETPPTEAPKVSTTTPATLKPETTTAAKPKPTEATTTKATTSTKKPETDKSDVKVSPAPEPHHILTGILLPIFIVLAFIGTVFTIRKYDLIERAHGYIRNRNQQTRYNGLMENDFDDDPLLI